MVLLKLIFGLMISCLGCIFLMMRCVMWFLSLWCILVMMFENVGVVLVFFFC